MLEIDNLYKTFGDTKALNGMSFKVNEGEMYGFVGSNGAGKTTPMRIILGVLKANSGQVRLGGKPIDFNARKNFGYMPEERGLYPRMKVGEQLIYLAILQGLEPAAAKKAMEYWTERLGVAARRNDQVQALSLGNQQRVQLSAALIHNPHYLVLDEPFSGLDPVAVDVMSSVLREKVDQGAMVIFSSHQLELVERICDRVGISSQGRIVAEGSIDTLRSTDTRIYEIDTDVDVALLTSALAKHGAIPTPIVGRRAVRVDLPNGVDDQAILREALALGPVRSYALVRPHLHELFKDVVVAPQPEAESKPKKKGLFGLFGGK